MNIFFSIHFYFVRCIRIYERIIIIYIYIFMEEEYFQIVKIDLNPFQNFFKKNWDIGKRCLNFQENLNIGEENYRLSGRVSLA